MKVQKPAAALEVDLAPIDLTAHPVAAANTATAATIVIVFFIFQSPYC